MLTLTLTLTSDLHLRRSHIEAERAPFVQEQRLSEVAVDVFDGATAIRRRPLDHRHDVTNMHLENIRDDSNAFTEY